MAEISSLLGLITDDNTRQALIAQMENMFDNAPDEERLIQEIGNPTKVAVALIRYADSGKITPAAAPVVAPEQVQPKRAVDGLTLTIPHGSFTVLVGPSGCGKTTLLRMIAGFNSIEGGTIKFDDKVINDIPAQKRNIGMVFQKPTPFPMSIYDNIAFGVRLFEKLSRADMDERVQWALTKAALWNETKDKLHQSGYSLSGGQQQRLCIARGIAIRPEVLLLDEPCSALDPISTGRIEELITELKQDYTVVIVTHNMQQAARCSDHTAFMYLGELIEFSNTDDLFTKPAKKQTEDYITGRYG